MLKHGWIVLCFLFVAGGMLHSGALAQSEIIGPETYPDGVNPLTGLQVEDPDLLNRRPVVIKISNFPPVAREYQSGLNDADLVWEHLLAGGVTRFSAVFYGTDLEKVGPIRSGRLVDFELTRIYRALFTFSGMSQGTREVLATDALMVDRVVGGASPCPALCRYPQDGLAMEHTLFANTAELHDLAVEREKDPTPEPVYGMAFSDEPTTEGTPLTSLMIRYAESTVEWEWDADNAYWVRYQDGELHMDNSRGEPVHANNVVVVEEVHTIQPFVSDQYWGPPNFAFSVNFIGTGRIFFLRDGQMVQGEWRRDTREEPLRFFDLDGNVLPFKPGNTFFNLVPLWIDGYELEIVPEEPPSATVNGDTGVSMRYGPNPQYVSPDVAYPGDTFALIGRNFDGTWVQVKRGDERAVWLPIERVTVDGVNVDALPLVRPANER